MATQAVFLVKSGLASGNAGGRDHVARQTVVKEVLSKPLLQGDCFRTESDVEDGQLTDLVT